MVFHLPVRTLKQQELNQPAPTANIKSSVCRFNTTTLPSFGLFYTISRGKKNAKRENTLGRFAVDPHRQGKLITGKLNLFVGENNKFGLCCGSVNIVTDSLFASIKTPSPCGRSRGEYANGRKSFNYGITRGTVWTGHFCLFSAITFRTFGIDVEIFT